MASRSSATRPTISRRSAPRVRPVARRLTWDEIAALPIPARMPPAGRDHQMRFYARHGADCRQDQADLEADLRAEFWARQGS